MIEQLITLIIVFAICWLVIWLVDRISVPYPFNWILKLVFILILLAWVLDKFGIYHFSR